MWPVIACRTSSLVAGACPFAIVLIVTTGHWSVHAGSGVGNGVAGVGVGGVGVGPARLWVAKPRNAPNATRVQSRLVNRNIASPSSKSKHP